MVVENYGPAGQDTDDNTRRMRFLVGYLRLQTHTQNKYLKLLLLFHGKSG